jgi:predicted metal-dependent peptidase
MKIYTPEEKVANARIVLCTEFVFFGSVFLRLNVHEDPTCETAWVDGRSIGYNLAYCATLDHREVIGLFVHEVLHVILKHHLREAMNPEFKKQHDRFNRAADYALNPIIDRTDGMSVNANWLLDLTRWEDDIVETIFKQLPTSPKDDICKDGNKAGDASGPTQPGEVRPFQGGNASVAEAEQASNEIDQWVQAAGMKAKGVGKMTGGTERLIKAIVEPQPYWGDELQHLLDEISKNDYCWNRPNVRYMQQGLYLPSLHSREMPDLVVFVDVSGSLHDRQLTQIKAEIRTIVFMYQVRIVVVYWDTGYHHHEEFLPNDVLDINWTLNAQGGGGTAFTNCWNWLEEQDDIDPKGILFFTDCECSRWPKDDPEVEVIWAQVSRPNGTFIDGYLDQMPDYGTLVKVTAMDQDDSR